MSKFSVKQCIKSFRHFLWHIYIELFVYFNINNNQICKVEDFYHNFQGFRSYDACAESTQLDKYTCRLIKNYLYKRRLIGLYRFEAGVIPQKFMRQWIREKFPKINKKSYILEVGPGNYPVFQFHEWMNWYAVDKNLVDGEIQFKHFVWAKDKYPSSQIFAGSFENLSDVMKKTGLVGGFDLLVASHTYEHVNKPITALKEANSMLKTGGIIVLFVPDGFSDDVNLKDPTHTLYVVPGMMEEFFHYAGGFSNLQIQQFRPNADLVVSAIKD